MSIESQPRQERQQRQQRTTPRPQPPTPRLQYEDISANTADELYSQLLARLQREPDVAAAGFYQPAGGLLTLRQHNYTGPVCGTDSFTESAADLASTAVTSGPIESKSNSVRNLRLLARPIAAGGGADHALVVAMVVAPNAEICTRVVDLTCALAALWHTRNQQQQIEGHLRETAVTMDLVRLVETADNTQAAGMQLVNNLQQHLGVTAVALGLVRNGRGRCRIVARSGLAEVDAQAEITRIMQDAFDECLVRRRTSVLPPEDTENRHTLLAHQRLADSLHTQQIVSTPLLASDGEVVGVWMTLENDGRQPSEQIRRLLELSAESVANALRLRRRAERPFAGRTSPVTAAGKMTKAVIVAAVLSLVLLIPVPHRISCHCSAEPDVRRYVVAPHAGLLESTLVEAGDVVRQGQLLARMDWRDVRWELAGLAAERATAIKQRDAALVEGDIATSQRAALDVQRVTARTEILQRQQARLELTSPVDGIVLDGHLERVANAPVTIGQPVYEVAPLSPVTVEVAIPDEDYAHVADGFRVDVHFDGITTPFAGVIESVRPRSEIRDADNVFIATVLLDNPDATLRPGMQGYARITGRTRSLGWTLFHKPAERLQSWLPFL